MKWRGADGESRLPQIRLLSHELANETWDVNARNLDQQRFLMMRQTNTTQLKIARIGKQVFL